MRGSDSRLTIFVFITLTIIAFAVATQHYYILSAGNKLQFTFLTHLLFNLVYWWWWILFLPLLENLTGKSKNEGNILSHWYMVYIAIPLVLIILHQVVSACYSILFITPSPIKKLIFDRIFRYPWAWVDFIIYFALFIAVNLSGFREKDKVIKLKIAELQKQFSQSRLNALRSQIHPHFLFNTLNTLSTLILKEDNAEAERMLQLLTSFLQTTINDNEQHEVPLSSELKFIRDYLEIEKVRFRDKLVVNEFLDPDSLNSKVPSFILQPVIENAIHHAIAQRTADGVITIASHIENNNLVLSIEDNGPGKINPDKRKSQEGIGLKITKDRLNHLFGENHSLNIESTPRGGFRVRIIIPNVPFEQTILTGADV
jgi:two-component system, LytTR family, sensor kinase